MSKKPQPAKIEILPPASADEHPLRWFDMPHYRQPLPPPPKLPSPINARLAAVLEEAMELCKSDKLPRTVAAAMLRALAPITKRQKFWQEQHASDRHFSDDERKLAEHILNLLTFGRSTEYSRTDIHRFLQRRKTSAQITAALTILRLHARVVTYTAPNIAGRSKPRQMWRLSRMGDFPGPPLPPRAEVTRRPSPVPVSTAPRVVRIDGMPVWGDPDDERVKAAVARAEARQQRPPQKPIRHKEPPVWR